MKNSCLAVLPELGWTVKPVGNPLTQQTGTELANGIPYKGANNLSRRKPLCHCTKSYGKWIWLHSPTHVFSKVSPIAFSKTCSQGRVDITVVWVGLSLRTGLMSRQTCLDYYWRPKQGQRKAIRIVSIQWMGSLVQQMLEKAVPTTIVKRITETLAAGKMK